MGKANEKNSVLPASCTVSEPFLYTSALACLITSTADSRKL